jgi:hypothetical protein
LDHLLGGSLTTIERTADGASSFGVGGLTSEE